MNTGVIKVAEKDGVFVIKMIGDVRLTLSLSFDEFIEKMFASSNFCSVIFDLTEAQAIDSTTLGLMAKISLKGRALAKTQINGHASSYIDPIVISSNPGITRLLDSMGFAEIFQLVQSGNVNGEFKSLEGGESSADEHKVRQKVLEAHQSLVALNAKNSETFSELIQSLENI